MINPFRRKPADLMGWTPEKDPLASKYLAGSPTGGDLTPERNEALLKKYGGGQEAVPVGTILVTQPGQATRVMTGVGTGSIVRKIEDEVVQPSDKRWSGEQVKSFMTGATVQPTGGPGPQTVAERLLGPSTPGSASSSESSVPSVVNQSAPLFYDETFFSTSSNKPKTWVKMQGEHWINNVFQDARAARNGFASLADYDQWFRSLPGDPRMIGDVMKEAWLVGMPENVRKEYFDRVAYEDTQRREEPQARAFSAASGIPVTTQAEVQAASLGSEVANRAADQKNAESASLRAERNLQILEEQNKRDQANADLSAEERKRKQEIFDMARSDVQAGIDAGDPGYVMSPDGKFYRNRGDLDPVTGGYNWKPYNPWTFSEQLGAAMGAGASAPSPAPAAGPDVTGTLQTQAEFISAFKEAHGREPSATELKRANGKYWR